MNRELIINATPGGVEIALMEEKRLVELHREKINKQFNVGDIYIGKVKKLIPGLNALFVDVGSDKDAFLHYTDLSPYVRSVLKFTDLAVGNQVDSMLNNFQFEPETVKTGKVKDVFTGKQNVLVQILKEPISTKGPRLSCEITLAGRYLVLVPFTNGVGVSKKIASSEERKRLDRLIESIKPKNFGVVVRTAASGKSVQSLHEDLESLINKWKLIASNLKDAVAPAKILGEMKKTESILRDLLNDTFSRVIVNDLTIKQEVDAYIEIIAPEKKNIVQYYNSKLSLFDSNDVTRQIKSLFGKSVNTAGGAYLVIEHTEALHVIDVNSGHKVAAKGSQENTAIQVNMAACDEIARQLRLRDLGGIIIIDFIDVRMPDHKRQVFNYMRDLMKLDRAKNTVLPLSKFGLMQITRQRVRPEVNINTQETCPTCKGTGSIEASILITDEIQSTIAQIIGNHKKLKLYVHPYLDAYFKKGKFFKTPQWNWYWKYKKWIDVNPNSDFGITEYRLFDSNGEEIKL